MPVKASRAHILQNPLVNLPMSLRITCEYCDAKISVRADKLGQQFKCPSCRNVISAPTTANDQDIDAAPGDTSAVESFDEGAEGFNFAEEFDLEGLLPESEQVSEDLSRMPPARKPTSRGKKLKAKTATSETQSPRTKSRNHCTVCKKQLDPGVRYCTGCGHNNFDADAVAVDAQMKMQSRMEQLTASLGVARILKIFGRMFR